MKEKAIIFDCFGVLYPVFIDIFYKKHSARFGEDYSLFDKLNLQIDLGQIDQAQFYAQISQAIDMPSAQIESEMKQNLILDKELVELIKRLSNKYKIGLLSNAGSEEIQIIYQDGIDSLFDAITVSYEVGDVKPNPKIFTTSLGRLSTSPESSIFVDDSPKNLRGAEEVGMSTIHYPEYGVIPQELKLLAE